MAALMTGQNAMEIMWNGEKVTGKVQKVMMIAAIKWTLLTVAFIGQDKTQWGTVESSARIRRRWRNFLTKLPGVIGQAS